MLRRTLIVLALSGSACGMGYETWGQPLGEADRVVVLFHGFGAPATDLKGLAVDLREYGGLRDTCFVLARGPESAGSGRAWFNRPEEIGPLRDRLISWLGKLERKAGLLPSRFYLGGFSQGATVAVDLALHAPEPVAGVLVFSGAPDPTGAWNSAAAHHPSTRFLIAHGSADRVVSGTAAAGLRALLERYGHPVVHVPFEGGHEMSDEVRRAGGRFLSGQP